MSVAITRGVKVLVQSRHHPERSTPGRSWFFSYTVRIENLGEERVQLLARHWEITDGYGKVNHVRGPGVVGEQPTLEPGEGYVYTSACPLSTPLGQMEGSYTMELPDGEQFEARIAPFALVDPASEN
jgi:ApaG protein